MIVSADDPAMHSSQDEQDNRNYAKFAKMPMIEPADADEALRFVKTAYEVSERFGTAVLYRTTTRTSHAQGVARLGERVTPAGPLLQLERDPSQQLMMPHNAIPRHAAVEQRLLELAEYAETTELNSVQMGDTRVGIVASGAAYGSAKEAFPQASFLKLGMSWPLPKRLIADFRARSTSCTWSRSSTRSSRRTSVCRACRSTAARTSCRSAASSTRASSRGCSPRPGCPASTRACSWMSPTPSPTCPTGRRHSAPAARTAACSSRCAACAPS